MGAMRLSTAPDRDEARALATLHAALDAGVTLLDTADAYCRDAAEAGHNERLIARALATWSGDASRVRVATKGGLTRPGGRWVADGRARHLAAACEASRRALGVDRIHLYQLHAPDPRTPLATSVRALAALQKGGLVEQIGLCNVTCGQLREAADIAAHRRRPGRAEPLARREPARRRGRALRAARHPRAGAPAARRRRGPAAAHAGSGAARGGQPPWRVTGRCRAGLAAQPGRGAAPRPHASGDVERPRADVVPLRGGRGRPGRALSGRAHRACPAGGAAPAGHRPRRRRARDGHGGSGQEHGRRRAWPRAATSASTATRRADASPTSCPSSTRASPPGTRRVVLDNTYLTRASRNAVVETAWAHGVPVRCVWLQTSLEDAQVNVVQRMLARHGRLLGPGRDEAGRARGPGRGRAGRALPPPSRAGAARARRRVRPRRRRAVRAPRAPRLRPARARLLVRRRGAPQPRRRAHAAVARRRRPRFPARARRSSATSRKAGSWPASPGIPKWPAAR